MLKRHWPALVLAIIIGVLVILPMVRAIQSIGLSNFQHVYPLLSDDEDHYMSLIREVYDGHLNLSNPYFQEYKNGPYTQPPFSELYYASFAKLFGVSVADAAFLNDFLLPFISVLLLYALLFDISGSRKISLGLTALFFAFFISTFSRPINPQFSFPFLILGLWLAVVLTRHTRPVRMQCIYAYGLSLVFGALVYMYPFYWMTIAVVFVSLVLVLVLRDRQWKYWGVSLAAFLGPAAIWSVPYLLNTLQMSRNPYFAETNLRFGFILTHLPGSFFAVGLILVSLPAIYFLNKISSDSYLKIFAPVLVASGVILNWQNIITGKTLQFPPHFYPIMVLFVIIISAIVLREASFAAHRQKAAAVVCISMVLIFCAYRQRNEVASDIRLIVSPPAIASLQPYALPLQWIQNNTPKDASFYVLGSRYDWLLPIYTDKNIYFVSNAGFSLLSDDELENRWAIQHFFDSVTAADIAGNRDIWSNKFIDAYQNALTRYRIANIFGRASSTPPVLMPDTYVDRVLNKVAAYRKEGFEKALKTYSADYLVLDTSDPQYAGMKSILRSYKFLSLEAEVGNTAVYKVQ